MLQKANNDIKERERRRRLKYLKEMEKWKKRLKDNPQSLSALENLARLSCWLKRPKATLNYTARALKINPRDSESYGWSGHAYLTMHKNKRAVELYKKAVAINPRNAEAYLSLATGYHFLKSRQQQLKTLKKALSIFPDSWDVLHEIGWFYESKELYEKAIPWYQKALKLKDENIWTLNHLAHTLFMAGHYKQSANVYRRLIKINPKDQYAKNRLANALQALVKCERKNKDSPPKQVSPVIKEALQENRVLLDKNKNMAVDLMKMSNNFFSIALHHALAGKWKAWQKSMPIGTTFKFNDEMLLRSADKRVVHLTKLSNSLRNIAKGVKNSLTDAYLSMPVSTK